METHVGKKINDETHIHITLFRRNHSKSFSKTSASGEWEHCWDDFGMFEAGKSIPFFLLHHCSSRYKSCGRRTSPMGVPQSWGYPERDGWLVYFMENPSYKWDDDWLPINTLILCNLYIHLNSVEQAHDFEWWTLGGRLGWPSHHDREDCSWKLKASGWLVLTPYLMLVLWHPCDPLRSVAIRCGLVEFSVGWCWMMLDDVGRPGWIQWVQNHGISPLWFREEFPGTSQPPRKGHPKGLETCDNLSRHVEGMCILR